MSIPARMTAIAIREPGPPDVLVPQERDVPVPKAGEVLVKIAAAGVNRPDVMQREGKYPPPAGAPDIPGLEHTHFSSASAVLWTRDFGFVSSSCAITARRRACFTHSPNTSLNSMSW